MGSGEQGEEVPTPGWSGNGRPALLGSPVMVCGRQAWGQVGLLATGNPGHSNSKIPSDLSSLSPVSQLARLLKESPGCTG